MVTAPSTGSGRGEEKDDYYKIAPPNGAYLWVSSRYVDPLGQVGQVPMTTPTAAVDIVSDSDSAADANEVTQTEPAAVVPTSMSSESDSLKKYYELEKKVKAEQTKPVDTQDYAQFKKPFTEIVNAKNAGKAARYAKFSLQQIKRYELALTAKTQILAHDAELAEAMAKIEEDKQAKLAQVQDLGVFTVIGKLETSKIFGPEKERQRFVVLDKAGKIQCYAIPSGKAKEMDLTNFVGTRVGLIGTAMANPETAGALVRFYEIQGL